MMKHALLLLSFIATQAQAQIIYTDVIPDATYNASNDSCSDERATCWISCGAS